MGIHNSSATEGVYTGAFVEWGSNSDVIAGIGTGWRTLTNDEWIYLFNSRAEAASKYGYATVAGKHGIITVPDDFTDPGKNNGSGVFVGSNDSYQGWSDNYRRNSNAVRLVYDAN